MEDTFDAIADERIAFVSDARAAMHAEKIDQYLAGLKAMKKR